MDTTHLTFHLDDSFVASFADAEVAWGFPCGGGNSLGEITFLTKYSRIKADGTKERWHECCRRVIEGMYSILKEHCERNRTPWNEAKAQRAAQDAYRRLFEFKWTPPGRGLWMMGTEYVAKFGSAALQNCAFLSTGAITAAEPTLPFVRLMEMSMLGVGVGFDTEGADLLDIYEPSGEPEVFVIPDSREGWCESVDLLLLSFLTPRRRPMAFDYSLIRAAGEPIRGFGGTAAGPEPLKTLHAALTDLLIGRGGEKLSSTDIVDISNQIGRCVVAGNVRRSAELALGDPDDKDFLDLKNWEINPVRMAEGTGWGNLSNNSVRATVGGNYDHLAQRMAMNGEPGLVYMDLLRSHGRLADPPNNRDWRAKGTNPCAEQTLEHLELCTLVETFPAHHESIEDYKRTIKVAYLYAKAVTLVPTHWADSNEVMQRNRRIGCSMSGVVQFAERHDWNMLGEWCDEAYAEVQRRDVQYSEWLGVRESIKTTSVKPSGTVSLLCGATPGVHFPTTSGRYVRRMRFRAGDPMVEAFVAAGYPVEPDFMDPDFTVVVDFPVEGASVRSEREVSVWEKVALAARLQMRWADNSVSATFSFLPHEAEQIGPILRAFDGQLKTASFLPLMEEGGAYRQMPYEHVPDAEFAQRWDAVSRVDFSAIYANGRDAEGEAFCTNDRCELPQPPVPVAAA
ncbi:MAG TPA: hypothetical protein VHD87_15290 [Acidimicrobiales bacterium]|nr:hypothetical protein [Acidimicrobiales bacterium]